MHKPKRDPNPTFNYAQPPTRPTPRDPDGKRAQYKWMQEHDLIMLIPAKCASTSVRQAFKTKGKGSVLSRTEVIASGLPVYAMLRHPVARFYSAWADKFPNTNFDDLLALVEKTPDELLDVHLEPYWRLMVSVPISGFYTPKTWPELQRQHPGVPDLPHANKTGRGACWKTDIGEDRQARILARYNKDDELFRLRAT